MQNTCTLLYVHCAGDALYQMAVAANAGVNVATANNGGYYGDVVTPQPVTYQAPAPMATNARMLGYGFPQSSSGYGTSHSHGFGKYPLVLYYTNN